MMHKHDGGPAFPLPCDDHRDFHAVFESGYGGMTLRDYFAAKICVAMMTTTSADSDYLNIDYRQKADGPTIAQRIASISYQMADAMLKEREMSND